MFRFKMNWCILSAYFVCTYKCPYGPLGARGHTVQSWLINSSNGHKPKRHWLPVSRRSFIYKICTPQFDLSTMATIDNCVVIRPASHRPFCVVRSRTHPRARQQPRARICVVRELKWRRAPRTSLRYYLSCTAVTRSIGGVERRTVSVYRSGFVHTPAHSR